VGPDNGLFSFLLNQTAPSRIVELNNPEYQSGLASTTFHGRDIFAPAAAHIANGVHLEKLGAYLDRLIRLPQPILQIEEGQPILGEILYADRFGNLVTSIGVLSRRDERLSLVAWIGEYQPVEAKINKPIVLLPDGEKVNFHSAFGEVPEGSLIAYIGSSGLMELAVNGASASEITGLQRGERIELRLQG
jgi:S-adenosylmethionine hydrolase